MGNFYRNVIIIFLLIPNRAWAQQIDCEQTIALATEEFNSGHFYSVPGILSECLNSFSREQKQRAFLLLTQTYLLLDDPIGAQRSYLAILTANPEFVPDEQLHAIDVVYLSRRFTATPKFSLFVGGGSNVSPIRVIRDLDIVKDATEKYTLLPGYHVGAGGEYSYSDHVRFRTELNFFQTGYRTQAFDYNEGDVKTLDDRQMWVNLPLYICYSDKAGKYRPYGYAGFSVSKLLSDKAFITLRNVQGEGDAVTMTEVQSSDFDFKKRRTSFNQSLVFGGGIKYKLGLDFIFAEVRYSAGLKNIVNHHYSFGDHKQDRASSEWIEFMRPATEYAHEDDYMRLDNISITVGFVRPLYKPREVKRVRTKGILRKMKRAK